MLETSLEVAKEVGQHVLASQIKSTIRNVSGTAYNHVTGNISASTKTVTDPTISAMQNPGLEKSPGGIVYSFTAKNVVGLTAKTIAGPIGTILAVPISNRIIKGEKYSASDALVDVAATGAGLGAGMIATQIAGTALASYILAPIAIPYAGFIATSMIAGVAGQAVKNLLTGPAPIEEFPRVTKNWLADEDYPHLCTMRDEFVAQAAKIQSMSEKLLELGDYIKELPLKTTIAQATQEEVVALENAKLMLAEYKRELTEMVENTLPDIINRTEAENTDRRDEYGNNFKDEVLKKVSFADQQILKLYYDIDNKVKDLKIQIPKKPILTGYQTKVKESTSKPTPAVQQKSIKAQRNRKTKKGKRK